jgi:hypothetical protein
MITTGTIALFGIGVFVLMAVGIFLTMLEFNRLEEDKSLHQGKPDPRRVQGEDIRFVRSKEDAA